MFKFPSRLHQIPGEVGGERSPNGAKLLAFKLAAPIFLPPLHGAKGGASRETLLLRARTRRPPEIRQRPSVNQPTRLIFLIVSR